MSDLTIYKADVNLRENLVSMFETMDSTIILSALQGHMGEVWVNDLENPTVAQIVVGIFVFYAGDPNSDNVEKLLLNLPDYAQIIVNTSDWKNCIETFYKGYFEKFQRYTFKKEPQNLDIIYLQSLLSILPEGYELRKIDKSLAYEPSFQELSEDFTSQYESIDDYVNKGVGFCILHDEKIVCGASSYSVYDDGIEIEIDTAPEHQRKGLATVAASQLILDCLSRGKYPNWDAVNPESVALAEKLGYVLNKSYDAYYINPEGYISR